MTKSWIGLAMILGLLLAVTVGIFIQSPQDGLIFLAVMGVLVYLVTALVLIIDG